MVHERHVRLLVKLRVAEPVDPVGLEAGDLDLAAVLNLDDGVRIPGVPTAEEPDQALAGLLIRPERRDCKQ